MGTSGQPGYVFRDFCLEQGIEFIIFCLNQGIDLSNVLSDGRKHSRSCFDNNVCDGELLTSL